jgi:hypothetical protein
MLAVKKLLLGLMCPVKNMRGFKEGKSGGEEVVFMGRTFINGFTVIPQDNQSVS